MGILLIYPTLMSHQQLPMIGGVMRTRLRTRNLQVMSTPFLLTQAVVLNQVPGVVENGLFIDICDTVVIGFGDGRVETRDINAGTVSEERLDFVEDDNLFRDV